MAEVIKGIVFLQSPFFGSPMADLVLSNKYIEGVVRRTIPFLGGDVEMVAAEEVKKIQDVKKMLEQARQMEESSVKDYNVWANECSANNDAGSRQIFEGLVADEERHYSQYDDEVVKIEKFGESYLALQSMPSTGDEHGAE